MLTNLDNVKTKGIREKIDYAIVKPVIWAKYKFGLGIEDNLQLAEDLHKPIIKKFKRRRVMVYNIDDIWSGDLINKVNIANSNKGYKYILTVIDIFTKYAYAIPLKSKDRYEILDAFKKLFSNKQPNKLWTDKGCEFTNNRFKNFLNKKNIELYHVFNEGKACVIERFNRTLGNMIAKHLTATHKSNYINVLQKLLDNTIILIIHQLK
jgi:IS30 family transposase